MTADVLSLSRTMSSIVTVVPLGDRKSTRLNSSHSQISYAVFCLKKKKTQDARLDRVNDSRENRSLRTRTRTAHRHPLSIARLLVYPAATYSVRASVAAAHSLSHH